MAAWRRATLLTVVVPIQSFSHTTSRLLWTPSVNPPIDVSRQRRYTFCASSTEDSTSIDEEMDVLFEELFQDSISLSLSYAKNNNTLQVPSHFIQGKETVGIGGNAGFVYDVNALKRNLVQESVKRCKQELLLLLGDGRQNNVAGKSISSKDGDDDRTAAISSSPRWRRDRDDLIEDRLAALVQANPVSTTTDSNLLDGSWSFAFATNSASTILDTSRFLLSKTKRIDTTQNNVSNKGSMGLGRCGPWRFRSGKTENPFRSSTRQIFLENLDDNENAHIIDETRLLGGLFQSRRRYDVYGLTRTSIDLDMTESELRIFGLCVNSSTRDDFKGTKQGQPLEIQVIYLDNDLCICTTGEGLDGPLHVYTKSDAWNIGGAKRTVRLIANTISWITSIQSPLRMRQRLFALDLRSKTNVISNKSGPSLKAINIGELDVDKDGATRADQFWDGKDDPFVHLSPGERMEVLKSMSLEEIYRSASERKEQNKKQKWKWLGQRNNYTFKRPEK